MTEMLRWGAATDTGRVREANEDAYLAEPLVFAVADGMGGHQAGEVASAMAADVLRDRLATGAPSTEVMEAAVVEANAAIFQTARRNSAQMGMGTTLTALAVVPATDSTPTQLALANVGDSRTYVLAQGRLRRATIDHSYVQELLATGHITEDEARHHPRRNIVTRALGIEPSVRVDSWLLPLVRGERYILCSDGLVDEVDDDGIAAIARQHKSFDTGNFGPSRANSVYSVDISKQGIGSITARDRIRGGQVGCSRVEIEGVITIAAEDAVVASAAIDRVVASAAIDDVVTSIAEDLISEIGGAIGQRSKRADHIAQGTAIDDCHGFCLQSGKNGDRWISCLQQNPGARPIA